MKLLELEPVLLRIERPGHYQHVDELAAAQGVMFLCPKCFVLNRGSIGTHFVLCWFSGRGVPDTEDPKPGRWEPVGKGLDDFELRAGSSSVLLTSGCRAHFFVRSGAIVNC